MIQERLTRRRLIALGTTVAIGATGLTIASEPARGQASVEWGTLHIPETDLGAEDGEVYAPHVIVNGSWRFRNLDTDPAEWAVYLLVDAAPDAGEWSAIGITDGETTAPEAEGEFTVRGAITASGDWSPTDFSVAEDGTARTVTVPVAVMFVVRDGAGDILLDAQASRDIPITVNQTGASAAIGADGGVYAQDDQGDPTPTVGGEV